MLFRPLPALGALALASAQFLLASSASAQQNRDRFEVSVTGGYRFRGSANVDEPEQGQEGSFRYGSGAAFGGSVAYRTEPDGFIYLWYSQMQAGMETFSEAADGALVDERDLTIHYLQFGGYLEGQYGPTLPYLGLSVGATLFAPSDDVGTELRPSGAIEGGVKIPVTDFLHVRLLGRLPVTLLTGKTEIFCIEPHGCKVSLDGKPIVQFELMGGLGVSF